MNTIARMKKMIPKTSEAKTAPTIMFSQSFLEKRRP